MPEVGAEFDEKVARRRAKTDWLRALERTAHVTPDSTRTICDIVDDHASRTPHALALTGEDGALTYEELSALSNRIARWALAQGLRAGDRVALAMANAPAYAAIWIGLARVGIVTALINDRLTGESLSASIATAAPRLVIGDPAAVDALASAVSAGGAPLWVFGVDASGLPRLDRAAAQFSGSPLDQTERAPLTLADPALLIYTSGTTGLPKAARVSHYRIAMWAEWFAGVMDARPEDRLYDCLPMHHSVGGLVAIGAMLAVGGAVVLRRSFSARRFWEDIAESGATIFQYIGELPRYLLSAPAEQAAPRHALRLCCGNGLRGDVWVEFQERYAIPRIIEFYAATEGTFSLFNLEGKPGAIGRIPSFIEVRRSVALVRFDVHTEQPERGPDGFCLPCGADEAGEAIGALDPAQSMRFEGYTDARATNTKILRDVFEKGDAWYRTGDLMRRDAAGYFWFVDRIGDTFRWKGENVSTSEVAAVLSRSPGVLQATVYGVAVPGSDGRAGMAALAVDDRFDLPRLAADAQRNLPRFALPLFLLIRARLEITGTFRVKKADLARDGFDPAGIDDELYVWRQDDDAYQRLDRAGYAAIANGAARL